MTKTPAQLIAQALYGNRIRVRVCGICTENDRILMIGHQAILGENTFWSPPGGGAEIGETAPETLKREFLEETGLQIEVGRMLLMNEFVVLPLHGIELFFEVKSVSGTITLGHDPEMKADQQLIQKLAWLSLDEIKALNLGEKHQFWHNFASLNELTSSK